MGRILTGYGYAQVLVPGHPRANGSGYVREHILVAEKALGRALPNGAVVHHVDLTKNNNANSNLVICQDDSYHHFLHTRIRIQQAGGNPNTEKVCSSCKRVLSRTLFPANGYQYDGLAHACRECKQVRDRALHAKHKDKINSRRRLRRAAESVGRR